MTGAGTAAPSTLDEFAAALQERRLRAGAPSYAQIAGRIMAERQRRGMSEAAAQVARSSVYDVFRIGRRRVNADLVAEIVRALGGDAGEAAMWRDRCIRVQFGAARAEETVPATAPAAPVPPRDSEPDREPVPDGRRPHVHGAPRRRAADRIESPAGFGASLGPDRTIAERIGATPEFAVLVMVAAVSVNVIGGVLANRFDSVLFLDTIGTAAAALLLGPWRGAAVGLLSNAVSALIMLPETIVFGVVNAAAGLAWGYGAKWWHADRTLGRFLALSLLVAGLCTVLGTPLNMLMYQGHLLHSNLSGAEVIEGAWRAVAAINLSVSLCDKLVSGLLAYLAVTVILRLRTESRAVFPTAR